MNPLFRITALAAALTVSTLAAAQSNAAAEAAKEPGAVVTPSGLVFRSLKDGTGPSPTATDTVKVHYRGIAADGKEIDSSYKRGEPAEFPVNRVIPCWREGLQLMKEGGVIRLTIPANLAYGERGRPPRIPANSTLVFVVELQKVGG